MQAWDLFQENPEHVVEQCPGRTASRRKFKDGMATPSKISKVRLTANDLVPIIQRRGNERNVQVAGDFAHYAYDQANLLLLAEDLFEVLSRIVRAAQRGSGPSQAVIGEAATLLEQITHR